jgi:hypothetical protein
VTCSTRHAAWCCCRSWRARSCLSIIPFSTHLCARAAAAPLLLLQLLVGKDAPTYRSLLAALNVRELSRVVLHLARAERGMLDVAALDVNGTLHEIIPRVDRPRLAE